LSSYCSLQEPIGLKSDYSLFPSYNKIILSTMGSRDSSSFASGTFPHKNPTIPFWRTQLHELDDHRSTEEVPESCDILIIGGGYAGIAAAYHLLCGHESSNNPRPSIVLAEARQACSGATGRNGTSNPSPC
jgi:hypothetical protein